MRKYELVFVLDPDLTSEKRKNILAKIKAMVTDLKGKIEKENDWGLKEFSYPIQKKLKGYYFFWDLSLPESGPQELDKKIKFLPEIFRFLLVKTEKSKPKQGKRASKGGEG
ncbi:30S ribosomal protein S6 [Patescibacteria group bacterium]